MTSTSLPDADTLGADTSVPAHHVLDGLSADSAADTWGAGLYHSPLGLFEFQQEAVVTAYLQHTQTGEPVTFVIHDAGLGKSHLTMAEAALLFEDGLLDHVLVVAESNKITDWAKEDFPTFTRLTVALYAGTLAKRRKMLADPPQVLVMTYETGRNDICTFQPRSKAIARPEMLTRFLLGKRVLIVFDEVSKLRTRSGKGYLAWDYLINRTLRKHAAAGTGPAPMVSGLTATPVERSPEDIWNAGRLLAPWRAGAVQTFYDHYVKAYDQFDRVSDWKNLKRDEHLEPGVVPLSEMFAAITLRKRKTDPDVIAQFPAKVENPPTFVALGDRHAEFYQAVEAIYEDADEMTQRQAFGLMRQIAGYPEALLHSQGKAAREIVAQVGAQALTEMGSAKSAELLAWARRTGDQQMIVFSFFGQSILPLLARDLRKAGLVVVTNHGQMSAAERQQAQRTFKAGDAQVFLSSDAGARGLNLGCGSALLHFDLPLLFSGFTQRSDRIHRIDSQHPSVTVDALIAGGVGHLSTVETAIADLLIRRNGWSDAVIEDRDLTEDADPGEQHLSAEDRKRMLTRMRRQLAG